ncbi:Hypothetical Protein RradSPS_2481 [Rubrobacter radiotolerans]|uniref:Uncharacterized protein n=1 Tax=Rubrobacter radiotolerans TaxID=42256 RepID=A0A023X6R8_RUBRA|nr:Hypothetical Protein RradSPS_2481 [Rubrobacter radiotolerans]SMC07694.1 hypothetical protein SAMN00767673_2554 [Rubrobacter radiotolerans DSM 5868]
MRPTKLAVALGVIAVVVLVAAIFVARFLIAPTP